MLLPCSSTHEQPVTDLLHLGQKSSEQNKEECENEVKVIFYYVKCILEGEAQQTEWKGERGGELQEPTVLHCCGSRA